MISLPVIPLATSALPDADVITELAAVISLLENNAAIISTELQSVGAANTSVDENSEMLTRGTAAWNEFIFIRNGIAVGAGLTSPLPPFT